IRPCVDECLEAEPRPPLSCTAELVACGPCVGVAEPLHGWSRWFASPGDDGVPFHRSCRMGRAADLATRADEKAASGIAADDRARNSEACASGSEVTDSAQRYAMPELVRSVFGQKMAKTITIFALHR